MEHEKTPALPSPLESVQYQFEKWRETRKSPREPIPGYLWAAAVRLLNQYSINRVPSVSECSRKIFQVELRWVA